MKAEIVGRVFLRYVRFYGSRWPIHSCFHVLLLGFAFDIQKITFVSCWLKAYATSKSFPKPYRNVRTQHSCQPERLNCSNFYLFRYVGKKARANSLPLYDFFLHFIVTRFSWFACSIPHHLNFQPPVCQITASLHRNV